MAKTLKQKVLHGSLWNLLGASGHQIFGLIIFVVLSRLLTPADFGTVALAIAFIELINIAVQFGMIEVLVREDELTEKGKNSIFWICLMMGTLSGVLIFFFAPSAENLFKAKGLSDVLKLLSVVPTLHALNTLPEALLKRNFEFKPLAYRILISTSLAGVISIVMAFVGFGMYSLVFQRVSSAVLIVFMLWLSVKWRPRFECSGNSFKKSLSMGVPIMSVKMVGRGSVRVVDIIVGLFLGPAALGYLKIAGKLQDFVVQFCIKPVLDVSLVTFSTVRPDLIALEKAYLRFIQICALLSLPAFLGLGVLAPELILLVFGEDWAMSGVVMQILCISCLSATLNYFFSPLVTAIGKPSLEFKIKLVEFFALTLVVTVLAQNSLVMVMFGVVTVATMVSIQMMRVLSRELNFSLIAIYNRLKPILISSIIMCSAVGGAKGYVFNTMGLFMGLGLLIGLGCLVYMVVFYTMFNSSFKDISHLVKPILQKNDGSK